MKRILTGVLLLTLILALAACGSGPAKDVENAIAGIGEVTEESGAAIRAARDAFNALTEADQNKVKNKALLEQAESRLAEIHIASVEDMISAIPAWESGTPNEGRKEQIKKAREAYNALPEELQAQVKNYDLLIEAELPHPFAEEQGFVFESPQEHTVPVAQICKAKVTYNPVTGLVSAPEIVSRETTDGFIEYEVSYTLDAGFCFTHVGELKDAPVHIRISGWEPYDYYTGKYLNSAEEKAVDGTAGFGAETIISYNGKEYTVHYSEDVSSTWGDLQKEKEGSRCTHSKFCHFDVHVVIQVPSEYDGLILGLNVKSVKELSPDVFAPEKKEDTSEKSIYWDEDSSEWVFIRLRDVVA